MIPTKKALADAGLKASEIDKVLLVGGSTRIPAVQEAVKKFIGKEPFKGINPDECVAIGAAIQGGVLSNEVKDLLLLGGRNAPKGLMPFGFPQCVFAGAASRAARRKSRHLQILRLQVKETCKHGSCSDSALAKDISFCLFSCDRRKFK